MRRHWVATLLFVLALGLRSLLPAAAEIAYAEGIAPGKTVVQLCLKAAADRASGQSQAPGGAHHGDDCPLCQASCDGALALLERTPQPGSAPVHWRKIAWTEADRALPATRRSPAHQARAPPSFS
jgi:hypothetical protein